MVSCPQPDGPLTVGIVASLIVHGAMLAVRFTAADPNRFLPAESQLEVVLLNASTQAKPVKAEVLAQVNSEAGVITTRAVPVRRCPPRRRTATATPCRRSRRASSSWRPNSSDCWR